MLERSSLGRYLVLVEYTRRLTTRDISPREFRGIAPVSRFCLPERSRARQIAFLSGNPIAELGKADVTRI
jgi:hypothetical protein